MSIANPIAASFEAPALPRLPTVSALTLIGAFFSRIGDAISIANEKRAYREVESYIARNGGMLTDSVERQLGSHRH